MRKYNKKRRKKLISIVTSALNEEGNIKILYKRIKKTLENININFEIIFIDNNSKDNTYEIMKQLYKKDKRVKCIKLSRTFDHQSALLAGIKNSHGDAVITMDSDLQHPPELLVQMIDLWEKGNQIVYTTKKEYKIPLFRYYLTLMYYYIISKISGLKLSFGQSDFRLMDRKVVDILCSFKERPKFLRGIIDWIGFTKYELSYKVDERKWGKSSYSYSKLISYGLNGIFSFSILPLRFFLYLGIIIAIFCIIFGIYYIIIKIISIYNPSVFVPPGWTTITVAILFFSSIQLIGIGLLGEYIGRIYNQVKERPEYIISEKLF